MVLAAVLGLAAAGWTLAEPRAAMSEPGYETARAAIERQYRADRALCERVKEGQARDICHAQAKGKEEAARARLEARFEPSPEAVQAAKVATAEANYKVAREKCDLLEGDAEDRCLDQAKAAREAAERQARVEKVESTGGIFRKD